MNFLSSYGMFESVYVPLISLHAMSRFFVINQLDRID